MHRKEDKKEKEESTSSKLATSAWGDLKTSVAHFGKALFHVGGFFKNLIIGHDANKVPQIIHKQHQLSQSKDPINKKQINSISPQEERQFKQEKKEFYEKSEAATWRSLRKACSHLVQATAHLGSALLKGGTAIVTGGVTLASSAMKTRDKKPIDNKQPPITALTGTKAASNQPANYQSLAATQTPAQPGMPQSNPAASVRRK